MKRAISLPSTINKMALPPILLKNTSPSSTQNYLNNNLEKNLIIDNQCINECKLLSSNEWERIIEDDALITHPSTEFLFNQQQNKHSTTQEMQISATSSGYASMGKKCFNYTLLNSLNA